MAAGVAVDLQGYVYSAGVDKTIRKITNDGNQVWRFNCKSSMYSVAADLQGDVYAGGVRVFYKISNYGQQEWILEDNVKNIYGIAVDINWNVYGGSSDNTVCKIWDGYIIHTA